MQVRALNAFWLTLNEAGDVPSCVDVRISIVLVAQGIVAGEILDVNVLSSLQNGIVQIFDGQFDFSSLVDLQTITTTVSIEVSCIGRNVMCKTVGVNVSQLIVRIRIAGALGNGGVLECALQSTVRIGGTGFQNVLIVRSTNAQEATGRTAESQGAVIGCIVNSTGLVRLKALPLQPVNIPALATATAVRAVYFIKSRREKV